MRPKTDADALHHPENSNSKNSKRGPGKKDKDVAQQRRPHEIRIRKAATSEIRHSNGHIAGDRYKVSDEKASRLNHEQLPEAEPLHTGLKRQQHCSVPEKLRQTLQAKTK